MENKLEDKDFKCISSSYHIMTINKNVKSPDKNTPAPTAAKRMELVLSTIEDFPVSVIFCQEVPAKLEKEVIKKCGSGVYEFAFRDKEAAVMWRTRDFYGERKSLKGKDLSSIDIGERLQRKRSNVDVSEVYTRTAMVRLTSRKTGASFLAVSWHGPSKVSDESKSKALDGLICFLCEVCENEKLSSFIIGGDFNLDTSTVDLTKHKGVTISRYSLCARDKNRLKQDAIKKELGIGGCSFIPYKDTFIVSVKAPSDERPITGYITVSSERPLEPKNESSDNKLMDHVPVVGVLNLWPYKKPYIEKDNGKLNSIFSLAFSNRLLLI